MDDRANGSDGENNGDDEAGSGERQSAGEPAPVAPAAHNRGARSRDRAGSDGTIADNLLALARRDCTLFSAEDGSTWADISIAGRRETWPLKSRGFRHWLVHSYYCATGRAPSPDNLSQALLTLDASARYDGLKSVVRIRTGAWGDSYYLDLADDHWRAVEIDGDGWRVIGEPPIRFQRPRGMLCFLSRCGVDLSPS